MEQAHREGVTRLPVPAGTTPRIDVLGAMRVVVDGATQAITAQRPRAVLACLAMHAGTPVSADRLLEEVWGDDLPGAGMRAVAYQIARRSLLGPDRVGEGTINAGLVGSRS